MPPPYLQARDLSKTYRGGFRRLDVEALKGLTIEVHGGEIFGLLGPNGAGKTTFVKLVLGLVRPTAGQATLLGLSSRDWRARRSIGYLPENHRFPEFLTAHQMLSLYGQLGGLDARSTRKQIDSVLDLVGMLKWSHVQIRKYSKGMMQRVGLAQSLLGDPDIVFLDEPTDGVDPIGRRDIRNVLLQLRDQGKTVFINSHLLSELEMVCSRVAIINKGVMVREGQLDSLLSDGGTYEIKSTRVPLAALDLIPELRPRRLEPTAGSTESDSVFMADPAAGVESYEIDAVSRDRLNEIIDALRQASVQLESVERIRDSLEDLFVRSVAHADGNDERETNRGKSQEFRDEGSA